MKIDINKIKQIPQQINGQFGYCVYGSLSEELLEWINVHNMKIEQTNNYTNIFTDKCAEDIFIKNPGFKYMDGFSPNLNKNLHIGHFSNLVLAKAFKSMELIGETVAILGNTLTGDVTNETGYENFIKLCTDYNYNVDLLYMASDMKCSNDLLIDGIDKYAGTKVFEIKKNKIVGIKNDKTTTYFYQDVALATKLNAPTLYLTGNEQLQHFELLKKMFPYIEHIGLGLVKANGKKMSSRLGNIIWMDDVIELLMNEFKDKKLCYNVFAGMILKAHPTSDKNIDIDQIANPLNSPGLYLSYTLAKLKSAGVKCVDLDKLISQELQFSFLSTFNQMAPNILLKALLNHAKKINKLYLTHKIKDNQINNEMFAILGSDMLTGMLKLGMFDIDKV